ncbi:helix-turn-helix domain-containing protein [Aliibacillus thermotolerans]
MIEKTMQDDEKRDKTETIVQNKLKDLVRELETKVISERIDKYGTTRKAAASLGISQSALVKKMKKLNIKKNI